MHQRLVKSHGLEHIGGLKRRRGACRARGAGHLRHTHDQRLPIDAGKAEVDVVRQTLRWMAIQIRIGQPLHDADDETLPQSGQALLLFGPDASADFTSLAKADDAWDVQSP